MAGRRPCKVCGQRHSGVPCPGDGQATDKALLLAQPPTAFIGIQLTDAELVRLRAIEAADKKRKARNAAYMRRYRARKKGGHP